MAERHPAYDGFISIHALREESDKFEGDDHGIDAKISIHALREESDDAIAGILAELKEFQSTPSARRATCRCTGQLWPGSYFNPRPPRGGRQCRVYPGYIFSQFQSTPSARRATTSEK